MPQLVTLFGVLKRCFRILLLAPEYSLEIQAQIPAALAAIHNFIHIHDPDDEGPLIANNDNSSHDYSHEDCGPIFTHNNEDVDEQQDQIAQAMWDDYQRVCEERGIEAVESEDDDKLDLADDFS